jgi:hypothetical protein
MSFSWRNKTKSSSTRRTIQAQSVGTRSVDIKEIKYSRCGLQTPQVSTTSANNGLCQRSTIFVCMDCYRLAGQRNRGMSCSEGMGQAVALDKWESHLAGRLLLSREFQKQEWTSLSPPHCDLSTWPLLWRQSCTICDAVSKFSVAPCSQNRVYNSVTVSVM